MDLFIARKMLVEKLLDAGVMNAETKGKYIFEHYSGLSNEDLYRFVDELSIEPWKYAQMVRAVNRLIDGTPVQIILGYTHFYDAIFLCKPGVLVPRPETESLVDAAISEIDERGNPLSILDIFTGSGIVAISLAKARPANRYYASDISRRALNLANINASRIGVTVDWHVGDMFAPFADVNEGFDIITANPPYIRTGDIRTLPLEVRAGDPREALDGGRDGLKFHRKLARFGMKHLKPSGCMIVEMGHDQKRDIREIFKPLKVKFLKDLWKKDRIYLVRND